MRYLIRTKLVGVTFPNKDRVSRQERIQNLGKDELLTIEHEPDNPYDLVTKILKVYRDPELRVKLRTNALLTWQRMFSPNTVTRQFIHILRKVYRGE